MARIGTRGARALLSTVLVGVSGATSLQAQRIELQLLGGQVSDESGTVGRGITLAPAVAWAEPGRWLRLEARGTALQGGGHLLGAGASGFAGTDPVALLGLEAQGGAALLAADGGFRSLSGEINPGVRVGTGAASVSAGVGVRGVSLSSSPAGWREPLPFSGARERTSVARSVWAAGRTSAGSLSLVLSGRESRSEEQSWRDGQAAASLALGELTLSGFAGVRSGDASGGWGGGAASLRVATGVELMAQVASYASDPLTGQPGGRSATLGVSLTHGGFSAPSVGRTPRSVRVSLNAAPGARVELLADWNDWRPVQLTDQGRGVFASEVRLPPGTYHFVFRVNGQVRLPEGYETAPDDFGGRSAVVRVRA